MIYFYSLVRAHRIRCTSLKSAYTAAWEERCDSKVSKESMTTVKGSDASTVYSRELRSASISPRRCYIPECMAEKSCWLQPTDSSLYPGISVVQSTFWMWPCIGSPIKRPVGYSRLHMMICVEVLRKKELRSTRLDCAADD